MAAIEYLNTPRFILKWRKDTHNDRVVPLNFVEHGRSGITIRSFKIANNIA